jgi:hypothetical protein
MPEALELPTLTAAAARAANDDDIPAAAALLRQAVALQISTLGPDHPDVATTLNNLALMLERLGHVKEAGQCYRRAHAIAAAALGPDDPIVQVSRANLDAFRANVQPDEGDDSAPIDPSVWGDLEDFPTGATTPAPPAAVEPEELATRLSGAVTGTAPESEPVLELRAEPGPEPTLTSDPDRDAELALAFAPAPAPRPELRRAPRPTPAPAPARISPSPVIGILVAIVLLAGAAWWWGGSDSAVTAPADTPPEASQPSASATPPSPIAPAASASPRRAAGPPAAGTAAPAATAADPVGAGKAAPPAAASRPVSDGPMGVTVARLCSALSRSRNSWACTPAKSPASGAVYYYTRVRSTRDATIRHRWSRDGRVVQDVRLRIRANPTDGFRTFSRQTVSDLGPGAWVVSLLGPDGTVLDEERFEVK